MDDYELNDWDETIDRIADEYPYPNTPDIVSTIEDVESFIQKRRRNRKNRFILRAAIVTSIFLLVILSVPSVRAAVIEIIQIGVVSILQEEPANTQSSNKTNVPSTSKEVTPTGFYTILDLAGETNLEEARSLIDFQIFVPSYPPDIGEPDRVIVQNEFGDILILAWLKNGNEQIEMALVALGPDASAGKDVSSEVQDTFVNELPAIWIEEPHTLWINAYGDYQNNVPIFIDSNVLIWQDGATTYRLETQAGLGEAIKSAESLQPLP